MSNSTIANSGSFACFSSDDCLEGICDLRYGDSGQCKCWVGWLSKKCDNNISKELPTIFMTWRVVMVFLNLFLFAIYFREVILKTRNRKKKLGNVFIRYKKSGDLSPKKLIFLLIFVMSICNLSIHV